VIYHYSIVRYVPDPVRGEQVNIGVIVAAKDSSYFGARFISRHESGRLRRLGFGEDFGFIQDLAEEMESQVTGAQLRIEEGPPVSWTLDKVGVAAREWANAIQVSEPRSALEEEHPDVLLQALYGRYVAARRATRERARDRRWIKRKVTTGLNQALASLHRDPSDYVHRDERIDGALDAHVLDYVLLNGAIRHLVETMSFETTDRRALKTEIDAFAWTIDDVREGGIRVPITVATIGGGRLLDDAQRIYEGLGANVIREPELDHWVDEVSHELGRV